MNNALNSITMRTTSGCFYAILFITCAAVLPACHQRNDPDEDERLEMDGTAKAMRQEFLMKRDPALNMVPTERLVRVWNEMKLARTSQANDLTWTERGPN